MATMYTSVTHRAVLYESLFNIAPDSLEKISKSVILFCLFWEKKVCISP